MILYKTFHDLEQFLARLKGRAKSIGFVPTMGALHDGHLALVEKAKTDNDVSLCSIFVNPAQFNQTRDLQKYPRQLAQDIQRLEEAGCDLLFAPEVEEIYPTGVPARQFDLGKLDHMLEGKSRPGHFQGVCRVMEVFLSRIRPQNFYMGLKDFQQCLVVKRLLETENIESALHTLPTKRETDGLAMSSRNMRLTKEDRLMAPELYKTLRFIAERICRTPVDDLLQNATQHLRQTGFVVDYLHIANPFTLENYNYGEAQGVILVAAYLGEIRLIDNLVFDCS